MSRNVVRYSYTLDASEVSAPIPVSSFRHCVISVGNAASTTLTFQVQGALGGMQNAAPNFAAAQTATNQWDYVDIDDLEDKSSIDGDTGIAYSGAAADVRLFEVNINALDYISLKSSSHSAGSVTVLVTLADNG